jgi:hypothetical protein
MKKVFLILILLFPVFVSFSDDDSLKSERTNYNTSGFINITVETNLNRLFFRYDLKEWCLSALGTTESEYSHDTSLSRITIPVKDFKCANQFVYRDFLTLLKVDQFPDLEIAMPQYPDIVSYKENSVTLNDVSLTVAGMTKKYNIDCEIKSTDDENQILSGLIRVKLTDHEIDPPVKWIGLVKVKNEIIVKFGFCIKQYQW